MSGVSQARRRQMARAFGTALREHRGRLKISQEQFAHRAELGRTFASLLERGLRTPTLTVFFTILEGLDVPSTQLLTDTLANFGQGREDTHCNWNQQAEMAKTPLRDGFSSRIASLECARALYYIYLHGYHYP